MCCGSKLEVRPPTPPTRHLAQELAPAPAPAPVLPADLALDRPTLMRRSSATKPMPLPLFPDRTVLHTAAQGTPTRGRGLMYTHTPGSRVHTHPGV